MSAAEIVAAVATPLEVALGDGRSMVVSELRDVGGLLRVDLTLLQDGAELAFANPWIIGNPPVHVRVDGEAVHDPEAAFLEMILTSGFFHG
jgi:hypothetical protein